MTDETDLRKSQAERRPTMKSVRVWHNLFCYEEIPLPRTENVMARQTDQDNMDLLDRAYSEATEVGAKRVFWFCVPVRANGTVTLHSNEVGQYPFAEDYEIRFGLHREQYGPMLEPFRIDIIKYHCSECGKLTPKCECDEDA